MNARVGVGYDAHALAPHRRLVLGGVEVPYERGLLGHSDADVLIHALVDALLGAAALGDIGAQFPSSDERWKDQPSSVFLEVTRDLLRQNGWVVGNVDATVVAAQPSLASHLGAMRVSIASTLGMDTARVSVKTKSNNGLGFTGRGEGIACHAVAMIFHDDARPSGPATTVT